MGTQAGWQPDWGWGALDLEAALQERGNFDASDIRSNGTRFYRANILSAGDRATLAWNRRVVACFEPGCGSGSRPNTVYTLSDLDLAELDAATGAVRSSSTSRIDNVEQVRATGPGTVVYRVTSGGVDGLPAEPFALASRRPLTAVETPQPTTELRLSDTDLRPGEEAVVSANVANPSRDLTAENVSVSLRVPAGVELVDGTSTRAVGTLAIRDQAGDRATLSWRVRATTEGPKRVSVETLATRYGADLRSSAATALTVDGTPPLVWLSSPAPRGTAIELVWGANDNGSSIADYDVEVSRDGGQYAPWLSSTRLTRAEYPVSPGAGYRFRVRARDALGNVSAWVESDDVTPAAAASAGPAGGSPILPVTPPLGLDVRTVRRSRGRLLVAGRLDDRAQENLTVVWRARVTRRRLRARAVTYPRRGRFRTRLRLPRLGRRVTRSKVAVTYAGDRQFPRQTVVVAVTIP